MSTAIPNHRRTKPGGIKPGATNSGVTGPTSQIPGLCQSATDSAPAERSSGRRVGIFESDSDYVKLAKQGGHKGLGGSKYISFEERQWHNNCFNCKKCGASLVGRGFLTSKEDIYCPDCGKDL